ncbi:hypothetical protein TcasGA2_TC002699 [Tribolium castaneum]|uniref:Uncharacterized protein n=1 Tax=Tribolium castaneum TaxID=7070 RepID=D6WDW8_TRICA|nr:hypothetical protein TcasGA2_TC002699 [Tribolium castaneum]
MEPAGVHKLNTKGIYTDTRMEILPHQTTCGPNGLWPFIHIWDAGEAKLCFYTTKQRVQGKTYQTHFLYRIERLSKPIYIMYKEPTTKLCEYAKITLSTRIQV